MVEDGESHSAQTHVDDSCRIANMVIYALVNPTMAIADESHSAQSHVDDGCGTANVVVYDSVNPTKIPDEDEAANKATSGLVNP